MGVEVNEVDFSEEARRGGGGAIGSLSRARAPISWKSYKKLDKELILKNGGYPPYRIF